MRKMHVAVALGVVAIVAVAPASGAAAKGQLKVNGKVNIVATPINEVTPPSTNPITKSVTVTGKVKSQAACVAGRKIQFTEVTPAGSFVQSVTVVTNSKGSFTAILPFDRTGLNSKSNGTAVTVSAIAAQATRKDKQSGEKVKCLEASGISDFAASV
jgi:hypothetical protein